MWNTKGVNDKAVLECSYPNNIYIRERGRGKELKQLIEFTKDEIIIDRELARQFGLEVRDA